jgi:hypothetical protein
MVQISEHNVVPEYKANAHQGRTNDKRSSGAYHQYESFDMIKIAFILHFPPIIENFNTPMNKLPVFPGADCLAKMRAGCGFYENGHCIPVNPFALQNEGPSKTLRFAIEPLKEFEEMKPSNPKGTVAAAATYSYLNPNSAIAKTAQASTFGIAPTLATLQQQVQTNNNLGAGGHFQQQVQTNNSLEAKVVAGEVAVQRGRAAGNSDFSEFDNEDHTSPMWTKLMQHPAMKNSPIVVNNYNNSTAVHNSSPTRHAAPRAIDLSGSINADVARYCEAIGVDPKAQGAIKSQESTQGNQGCHESGGRTPRVLPRLRKPESFHRRSVLIHFQFVSFAQQQHAQRI